MRDATDGEYPSYIVWENVLGALTSNKGRDFGSVLSEISQTCVSVPKSERWAKAGLVRAKGVSVGWRSFDSQFWGVPQRRKRVFVVGCFDGRDAGRVLFQPGGLPGGFKKNKQVGSGSISEVEKGSGRGGESVEVFALDRAAFNQGKNAKYPPEISNKGVISPVIARGPSAVCVPIYKKEKGKLTRSENYIVRRLSPVENERLQGFPDNWTLTNNTSNTARQRLLGNSLTIPPVIRIFEGIDREERLWKNDL